jgi:regulator of protease activity HflC (stomatin/prohibitin superfamily)
MRIDTVVFYQITDPKLYTYGVENPMQAIENLTATTLRNIIGDLELDETLTSRETINTKMRATLDVATDPWGIKVNRVELKNIMPPAEIQNAMEKQMKAERERREAVTRAEGDKKAKILEAEGNKESAILNAEAEKQAMILHADAHKQKMILEAEGQAEAILKVQQAKADGLKLLKDAEADGAVLKLKSLEAFEKVADGQATTILLPADLQGIASMGVALEQGIKTARDAKPGVKKPGECEAPHSGYEDCPQ